MNHRLTAFAFAATLAAAAVARADDTPPRSRNPIAGIVLTTVGGSLIFSAPATVAIGAGIAKANDSFGVIGPFLLAAFANACVGLGMLTPGLVLLATHKRAVHAPRREPTWNDWHPLATRMPRMVSIPLLSGSF